MALDDRSQQPLRTIFVISPIAKIDEDGFDFTKLFLDEIVKPAALAATGYASPVRADEIKAPGSITGKVVRDIVNADVCIADLTGRNPNVMYEVAIAHAADKPVILLQQEAGGPPFDFTDERVIRYSTRADEANRACKDLTEHLRNARHEDADEQLKATMHPVRIVFRDLQTRASASDPEQAIFERLDGMAESMQSLEAIVERLARMNAENIRGMQTEASRRTRFDGSRGDVSRRAGGLVSRTADLVQRYLTTDDYDHFKSVIDGDSFDLTTVENLYIILRKLGDPDIRKEPAKELNLRKRAQELVQSMPPF